MPEKELFDAILTIIQKEAAVIIGTGCRLKRSGSDAEQKAAMEKEIAKLRQETAHNQKYLVSLYENYISGVLTKQEYLDLKLDYEQKIQTTTTQSQALMEQQKELEVQMNNYSELSDWLASVSDDMTLTGALVDRLIERIVVYDAQNISVHFKFKDEFREIIEVSE